MQVARVALPLKAASGCSLSTSSFWESSRLSCCEGSTVAPVPSVTSRERSLATHQAPAPSLPAVSASNKLLQDTPKAAAGALSATVMASPLSASCAPVNLRSTGMHRPGQVRVTSPRLLSQVSCRHWLLLKHTRLPGQVLGRKGSQLRTRALAWSSWRLASGLSQ
jgi:hypothetical protein